PCVHYMCVRDPERMGVMRFLRWINDKATKEGVNVIKDLRQGTSLVTAGLCVVRHRPLCFAGGLFPTRAVPSLFGFLFPIGHEDTQQSEDVSPNCHMTRAVTRPSVSQSVPSIMDC